MKKEAFVGVDVCYHPEKIRRGRIEKALNPHLTFASSGTLLDTGESDLGYVGNVPREKLGQLRKLINNMRRWNGIVGVSIRTLRAAHTENAES